MGIGINLKPSVVLKDTYESFCKYNLSVIFH